MNWFNLHFECFTTLLLKLTRYLPKKLLQRMKRVRVSSYCFINPIPLMVWVGYLHVFNVLGHFSYTIKQQLLKVELKNNVPSCNIFENNRLFPISSRYLWNHNSNNGCGQPKASVLVKNEKYFNFRHTSLYTHVTCW